MRRVILACCLAQALRANEPVIQITFPPAGSCVASSERVFIIGSVTPADAPLRVNGESLKPYQTGGFLYMAPVTSGTNNVTFQAGKTILTHSFSVMQPAVPAFDNTCLSMAEPRCVLGVLTGELVNISCMAPSEKTVCAMVGERIITLKPHPDDATRYRGSLSFNSPAEAVPIVFFSQGLADLPAAELTVREQWPTYSITGPLFETRARRQPGKGDTIAFLTPKLQVQGAGFIGPYIRFWLANQLCFVSSHHVSEQPPQTSLPPRDLPIPDLTQGYATPPPKGKQPTDMLIVLDPGHGGSALGAVGPTGTTEKEANLSQSREIKKVLEDAGYRVLLTRDKDVDLGLYERAQLAYEKHADAFISIHYNSCGSAGNPCESRHIASYAWNDIGLQLAKALHPHLAAITPIPDGGVRTASFAVCRNPAIPSCLLELDFIACPIGEEQLQQPEQRQRVAQAILAGLREWVK